MGAVEQRMQRVLALLLLAVLVLPATAPLAAAQAWEEDGWLETSMAVERIEAGDEFGCYGMPGLSWANDPGAVATACRDYLTARTPASIWGEAPMSLYTPRRSACDRPYAPRWPRFCGPRRQHRLGHHRMARR